jgi:alkaline phosphatase D
MSFPKDRHRIYRQLSFGALADVFLTDQRQYRTGSNDGQPRSLLGDAQMNWLIASLKASTAKWKFVANEVVIAAIDYDGSHNSDAWDGYTADRGRLLGEIEQSGIDNVVFLTGDAHVYMCNLLSSDFNTFGDGTARKPAGVEYVTGSVTSIGKDVPESTIQTLSPWNREYNGRDHGYGRVAIGPDQLVMDYIAGDTQTPGAGSVLIERFTQPAGTNSVARESHVAARNA